ncbi:hypothetical protein G1L02_08350 [Tenacibaculum finnmarkense]|uniref:hypothetical protein n=1 Tax=Tenacibaculum finnmarkense TaxID=2781243 RepID=UPI001EFB953A|nr:hypothetical protein [Tenacibaculum finnmarkense]MCG8883169.1 hypothetical protein [Tenacibaculum finnmarkense]
MGNLSNNIKKIATILKSEILKGHFTITATGLDGIVHDILVNQKYEVELAIFSSCIVSDEIDFYGAEKDEFSKIMKSKQRSYMKSINNQKDLKLTKNTQIKMGVLSVKIIEVATELKAEILAGNFEIYYMKTDFTNSNNLYCSDIIVRGFKISLNTSSEFCKSIFSNEMLLSELEINSFKKLLKSKDRAYKNLLISAKKLEIDTIKKEIKELE